MQEVSKAMIDIVIPTLMLIDSCPLKYSLQEACKSNLINQVIIIDNSGGLFEESISINSEKIQVLTMPGNIYVNPAWNLGVSKCYSENIVIMNDDVFCSSEVYMQIETVMKEENVGICSVQTNICADLEDYIDNISYTQEPIVTNNIFGNINSNITGWFFCIKRKLWKNIPDPIKIWYGDNIVYDSVRNKGLLTKNITTCKIGHIESPTIKQMNNFSEIISKDLFYYEQTKRR